MTISALMMQAIRNGAADQERLAKAGAAYDPAALALFAQMAVQPTTAQKTRINALIAGLKATAHSAGAGATLWSKMDRFHRFDVHDRQAARIDWIDPATKAITEFGGTVTAGASDQIGWDSVNGFNLITSSKLNYLNVGQYLDAGSNFSQNDGAFGFRIRAWVNKAWQAVAEDSTNGNGGSINAAFGMSSTTGRVLSNLSDGSISAGEASGIDLTPANYQTNWALARTASNVRKLYRGNIEHFSTTQASRSPGTLDMKLLFGDDGSLFVPPDPGVKMAGFWSGGGMAAADITALNALLAAFEAAA
jgi:hypothetical protein